MKKIAFYIIAALAAFTFFSCNKEVKTSEEEIPAPAKTGATITVKARTAETRTHIVATETSDNVTYKAYWDDEGEALGVILTQSGITAADVPAKLPGQKSGDEMIFSASGLDYADGTYNMFIFSPYDAYDSSGDGYVVAELDGTQFPVKGSFDPACDLLGYATDGVVIADGQATIENIQLMRPMAILRVNLNADASDPVFGEVVRALTIEIPAVVPLAGKIKITSNGNISMASSEYSVTALIDESEGIKVGAPADEKAVYFVVPPVTLPKDTPITFTVDTENYNGENVISYTFPAKEAMQFESGKVNTIDLTIKGGEISEERYAGGTGIDGDPWLVATPDHMLHMAEDLVAGETKYFKLIEDIDMDGVEWPRLNVPSPYDQVIDLDGNNKTISHLDKSLFYVFKGSVKDLTLDKCSVTNRGILAEYLQGTGHVITNVTVSDGSVNTTSDKVGGFIGNTNNGAEGVVSATITNCTVSGTTVSGKGSVGGFIGYGDAKLIISGCTVTGCTVTASGQYVGGFMGIVRNYPTTITDCHVEDATVNVNYNEDARGGGFAGQLFDQATISGCTVGTASAKVTINTKEPSNTTNVINAGGFVGVCYGTITKNGDVRSKAYAKITSDNTLGCPLRLGGFVGYHAGTIEYSDAIIDMTSLKGQHIGGFAGYVVHETDRLGKIDNCTSDGAITGNNYTGGFIGYLNSGNPEISNCTASGSVTAQSGCGGFVGQTMSGVFTNCSTAVTCSFNGSNNGGFAGQIQGGTLTGCSASGNVTSTSSGTTFGGFAGLIPNSATLDKCSAHGDVTSNGKSYFGGFIGAINKGTVVIKRCHATGNVISNQTYASPFIANITHDTNALDVTIENCYSTGTVTLSNQMRGGLIAQVNIGNGSATISNCYASGANVGSFRLGGLIGNVGSANVTVKNCAAWNSEVTASNHGQTNWSSGAVIGTAHPNCHASNNYRNPGMSLTVYCPPPSADWDHPDIDGTTHPLYQNSQTEPFTWAESTATAIAAGSGNVDAGRWAYHGKHVASGTTLSQLASTTLGWPADIWDFSGNLPTLK